MFKSYYTIYRFLKQKFKSVVTKSGVSLTDLDEISNENLHELLSNWIQYYTVFFVLKGHIEYIVQFKLIYQSQKCPHMSCKSIYISA